MRDRKEASTYAADRAWCARWLARGRPVWCVRSKERGIVVAYVANEIAEWTQFKGSPVDDYTVQQMVMRDGEAWFGPECGWPRPGGDR